MKDKTYINRLITELNLFNVYINESDLRWLAKNRLDKIHTAFMQSINTNIENSNITKDEKEELFKKVF